MITRPAEIAGLRFQDQLAERILDDAGAEPGSLALMAFTLNLICSRSSDQGEILASEYERIGGIAVPSPPVPKRSSTTSPPPTASNCRRCSASLRTSASPMPRSGVGRA